MKCEYCGTEFTGNVCPFCGAPASAQTQKPAEQTPMEAARQQREAREARPQPGVPQPVFPQPQNSGRPKGMLLAILIPFFVVFLAAAVLIASIAYHTFRRFEDAESRPSHSTVSIRTESEDEASSEPSLPESSAAPESSTAPESSAAPQSSVAPTLPQSQPNTRVTAENYARLTTGMTYAEVKAILGEADMESGAGEEGSADYLRSCSWWGEDSACIVCSFHGDRLTSKMQTGLQ